MIIFFFLYIYKLSQIQIQIQNFSNQNFNLIFTKQLLIYLGIETCFIFLFNLNWIDYFNLKKNLICINLYIVCCLRILYALCLMYIGLLMLCTSVSQYGVNTIAYTIYVWRMFYMTHAYAFSSCIVYYHEKFFQ